VQEEILDKYPEAKLKLYVVWEPMIATDRLRRTRSDLVTDPRALHFKDDAQISGKWFAEKVKDCTSLGEIAWDVFYLFGADADWGEKPSPIRACGAPVVEDWEELLKSMKPLLEAEK
jgi:hypothetical protein